MEFIANQYDGRNKSLGIRCEMKAKREQFKVLDYQVWIGDFHDEEGATGLLFYSTVGQDSGLTYPRNLCTDRDHI